MNRAGRWLMAGLVGWPLLLSPLLLPQPASAQGRPLSPQVLDLPRPNGAVQRVLLSVPADARGMIVMLPGGAGDVGIGRDGAIAHGDNFVVQTRALECQGLRRADSRCAGQR